MGVRFRTCLVASLAVLFSTAAVAEQKVKKESYFDKKLAVVRSLIQKFDYEGADRIASDIIASEKVTDEEFVQALRLRGSARLRLENYSEAIGDFTSLLRFEPLDIWALWQRCWAQTGLGNLAVARRDCDRAARIVRKNPDLDRDGISKKAIVSALANLQLANGNPQKAASLLSDLLKSSGVNPKRDWIVYYQMANIQQVIGNHRRAVEIISDVLPNAPETQIGELLNARGRSYLELGMVSDALADFGKAQERDPKNVEFFYNACAANLTSGRLDQALISCRKTHAINPENIVYIDGYGLALLKNKKLKEALKILSTGRKIDPENPYINYHLFLVLKNLGRQNEAEKLKKVISKEYFEFLSDN